MPLLDSDLQSIQEARDLATKSSQAFEEFRDASQDQVDRIVKAAADAANQAKEHLAMLAVEETGMGKYEDKIVKNEFSAVRVYNFIKDIKTVGFVHSDHDKRVYEVAEPMGVVVAIIPCTNPTSTAIYKILISTKARNSVVLAPHPKAIKCVGETAEIMYRAALAAGAPEGLISSMKNVSLQGTQELMKHKRTAVILATGGAGLVKSAYSAGKPAYGVGPGNVPAYIDRSANVEKAVADVVFGTTFDYGTICSSEQAIVCDAPVVTMAKAELDRQGAYFLNDAEREAVAKVAIKPDYLVNPEIVGKPATFVAEKSGISVPRGTRVLIAELDGVGRGYPLSAEKLSPILAFYAVADWREGCERCIQILNFGGMGHTLVIHCNDEKVIKEFALKKPASRICVNTPSPLGSIGETTNLDPAMTLGCGAWGGNITSDNITPRHLMHIKRLAYEVRPVTQGQIAAKARRLAEPLYAGNPTHPALNTRTAELSPPPSEPDLHRLSRVDIASIVGEVLKERKR